VVGLDAQQLQRDGAAPAAVSPPWDAASLRAALQSQMEPGAGSRSVRVQVSGDLCRHFMQAPPAGLRSVGELRALAAARALQLFGGKAGDWAVAADWQLDRPVVCAAMPAVLVVALQEAATALGLSLDLRSAVLLALARVLPKAGEGSLVWTTPTGAVLAELSAQGPLALRWLRRETDLGFAALAGWLQSEALQDALRTQHLPSRLQWACGPAQLGAVRESGVADVLEPGPGWPAERAGDTEAGWASRLVLEGG
jgi:hypothetical protein